MLRGPSTIDLTGTPDGNSHIISATATATASWLPGAYTYTIRAILDDAVFAVESGNITIKPDAATIPDGTETRSVARITLDNIDAVLQNRASQDQQRYSINNRELWRTPIADLLKLRAQYVAIVTRENSAARGQSIYGRSIGVRFVNPT